jgi:hypothetical protein
VKISLSFKRFNADDKFVFRVSDTDDDDFSVNRETIVLIIRAESYGATGAKLEQDSMKCAGPQESSSQNEQS